MMPTTTIQHWSGHTLYSTDTAPDDAQPMVTALLRATMAGRDRAELDSWRAEAVAELDEDDEDEDTLDDGLGAQLRRRIDAIDREIANPSQPVDLTGAILEGADLTGARLSDARLTHARLTDADLTGAHLSGVRLTYAILDGASLTGAILDGASLTGASLVRANLYGANLEKADLTWIRADVRAVLETSPCEVRDLLAALRTGQVDGSTYRCACCCLVGTLARVRGCAYDAIPGLKPDGARPAERWFTAISAGDTPETNLVSAITECWIREWIAEARGGGGVIG